MLFDDAHIWTGEVLSEIESPEFQQGKYNALKRLFPYAQQGAREAAVVVLKINGEIWRMNVGEADEVEIDAPANEEVALLHTHDQNLGHSERDWFTLLNHENLEQSHVIAPNFTFSLHKPFGWNLMEYGLEEIRASDIEGEAEATRTRNENKISEVYRRATIWGYESLGGWSVSAEIKVRFEVNEALATHFGIKRRIGQRRQNHG